MLELKCSKVFKANMAATDRVVVNQGGTSSTKTYSILQLLLSKACQEQGILISVVSESLPHLKRGALRDFIKILNDLGGFKERDYNRSNYTFTFGTSKIEFFSADQPDKLRGARRDYLFMNECNNIPFEAYNQLEVRTSKQIFLDYNPTAEFWVHEHLIGTNGVTFIKSTYRDNPFLEQNIIESIERRRTLDANWWRVYGLGEVGRIEGIVYTKWRQVPQMPEACKWQAYGLDFGYTTDPTALVHIMYANGELWLNELIYETGLTNQDIAAKFAQLKVPKNVEIFADSSEPKSIAEIKRAGYFVKPTIKGRDSVKHGIQKLQQYTMNVTKGSTNLIKELRNYKWKEKDNKSLPVPIDMYNHALDAVRYGVHMKTLDKNKILGVTYI